MIRWVNLKFESYSVNIWIIILDRTWNNKYNHLVAIVLSHHLSSHVNEQFFTRQLKQQINMFHHCWNNCERKKKLSSLLSVNRCLWRKKWFHNWCCNKMALKWTYLLVLMKWSHDSCVSLVTSNTLKLMLKLFFLNHPMNRPSQLTPQS